MPSAKLNFEADRQSVSPHIAIFQLRNLSSEQVNFSFPHLDLTYYLYVTKPGMPEEVLRRSLLPEEIVAQRVA